MRKILLFVLALGLPLAALADFEKGRLYDGKNGTRVSLADIARSVPTGSIVIVSEIHDMKEHHQNQQSFLEALAEAGAEKISVGMEFLSRPFQPFVDRFLSGSLDETSFLKAVEWGGNNFADYRRQVLFPKNHGGRTVALNAPRALTSRISKVGLAGLTDEERAELPEDFRLGNADYFERFKEVMGSHVPPEAVQRYFEAQSVWDEFMSSTAVEYIRANPEQRLMIIVGDFHNAYGGGLPDRLAARGIAPITISQIATEGLSPAEVREIAMPHARWGKRADYVWVE